MAIRNLYSSESWQKIYQAFNQINFSAYDYETIKLSIIDYLRIYYPEYYNDFIESSELVALIESFAYIAEQISYRLDMLSHEVFITTAQRKQSILKLAKLISYKPSRNIPARGLVKITSISTSEKVVDSNGTNLANVNIIWNDPNNSNWKEQFFLVVNRVINGRFGQFAALQEIGDVTMQLYSLNHTSNSLPNGIFSYTADTGLESFPMELVPVLLDENGPFEKTPDINSQLSVIYANDGLGDGSDYTGFLMYTKQGILSRIDYQIEDEIPNRSLDLSPQNVNETDVWVTKVSSDGVIEEIWNQVEVLADQNLAFYNVSESNRKTSQSRKKFEIETLENDAIKLIFGDGDFSDIPVGKFYFWIRQSANRSIVIPPSKLLNQGLSFQYSSTSGMTESCALTFSLTSTIQNSAASESIEHIRQSAPATYYSQNRMVNGQDYNTFMLKDQSILRLNSINRTFAGQPKYIEWNDASGQYQNVKLFGDDLIMTYEMTINSINTGTAISGRGLLDEVIEPLLSTTGLMNALNHLSATNLRTKGVVSYPRTSFIEDNRAIYITSFTDTTRINQKEKTIIQGAIDQHWYGEPQGYKIINDISYAIIKDQALFPEDDGNIWLPYVPRTVDGINPYVPGDVGSKLQSQAAQKRFALAFNKNIPMVGSTVTIEGELKSRVSLDISSYQEETISFEVAANQQLIFITSNLRGRIGVAEINKPFENDILSVLISQSSNETYKLVPGDAFILNLNEKLKSDIVLPQVFDTSTNNVGTIQISSINLLGRWVLIDGIKLPEKPNTLPYDPNLYLSDGSINPNSWLIWVEAILNPVTQEPVSFVVNYRELKLIVSSEHTKFWYNSNEQIIDPETKHRVFDIIRILRSNIININGIDRALARNENYDVVGPVYENNGVINLHALEVVPSDMLNVDTSGDTFPDNMLQFENFTQSYNNDFSNPYYIYYQLVPNPEDPTKPTTEIQAGTETTVAPIGVNFNPGSFVSDPLTVGSVIQFWGRSVKRKQLDFMWQHFTPLNNLIDPSVSNIHDTYILTQGYYDAISNYLQGRSSFLPVPPTPLELRNQYSNLLKSKMVSDTVVLHPGKIKLLFGSLAEPQLRAKFKIVKAISSTLTDERIRAEVLNVINSFFNIQNWDFGETFYATELFSLIHQRMPTEIASVVLVPVYAVNSFGSLFTVSSGLDEILQSAAQLSDIEIVAELNATNIRQGLIA